MSDQPKDAAQGEGKTAEAVSAEAASPRPPVEGTPAQAILQEVVRAAEKEAATKGDDKAASAEAAEVVAVPEAQAPPGPATESLKEGPSAAPAPAAPKRHPHPLVQAAAIAVALGLGGASGWSASVLSTVARARMDAATAEPAAAAAPMLDRSGAAFGIRRAEMENGRLASELKAVKTSLDLLKDSVERAKQDQAARLAQVGERLDRASRGEQDTAQKLASLSERLERTDRDGSAKAGERLDRPVATPAPAKVVSAAPELPAQTGSIAPAQSAPEAKPKIPVLEGWVLRDVDDGVALIEGRNRRLVEVGPGDVVPGTGGRVEAIERRGKTWIVVTTKGTIATQP